jgi:hypothetical protein
MGLGLGLGSESRSDSNGARRTQRPALSVLRRGRPRPGPASGLQLEVRRSLLVGNVRVDAPIAPGFCHFPIPGMAELALSTRDSESQCQFSMPVS